MYCRVLQIASGPQASRRKREGQVWKLGIRKNNICRKGGFRKKT